MAQKGTDEQRKYETIRTEWPVVYEIGSNTLTGSTVNVCNEGMMVESYLSTRTVWKVFKILHKKSEYRLVVKYAYKGNTYFRNAEVKHFYLDFSVGEPYRFTVGFWIPNIEKIRENMGR